MSTPVRVIVNFISRDPKSFVEAATKVRKEGGIELFCCIQVVLQQKYSPILHRSCYVAGGAADQAGAGL